MTVHGFQEAAHRRGRQPIASATTVEVFLLGLPRRVDAYVHVAGRTAREGRRGLAVSLIAPGEEEERLDGFRSELGIKVEKVDLSFM